MSSNSHPTSGNRVASTIASTSAGPSSGETGHKSAFNMNGVQVHVIDEDDIAAATDNNDVQLVQPHSRPAASGTGTMTYAQALNGESTKAVGHNAQIEGMALHNELSAVKSGWPSGLAREAIQPQQQQQHQPNLPDNQHANKDRTMKRQRSGNPIDHVNIDNQGVRRSARQQKKAADALASKGHPICDNVPQSVADLAEHERIITLDCIPAAPHLGVGSMVAVSTDVTEDLAGIVRWIGRPAAAKPDDVMVGVELEEDLFEVPLNITDGKWRGRRLFNCPAARGLFVNAAQCTEDPRFAETMDDAKESIQSPIVRGTHAPMNIMSYKELDAICGALKGIQGHHNSCYLDATLFGMFAFTRVFDAVLYRDQTDADHATYSQIQTVLRDEIVNPLRVETFVSSDRVMNLRKLLEHMCTMNKGLTSEEKDPEEFLKILLTDALRAEPFLRLSSGQDAFCYQLFVDRDDRLRCPSVQQLFDQSFLASDIKLREIPNCLIVQMPRFGKDYKLYERILPSLVLDVTDVIADSPRQCRCCGALATVECKDCFGLDTDKISIEEITYCTKCSKLVHQRDEMRSHVPRPIGNAFERSARQDAPVQRIRMDLFAVVCIETSHYVSFAKTGSGPDAPWCFFDSMADRHGNQNGYNVPRLESVADLPEWLSAQGAQALNADAPNDRQLPMLAKRLFCDAYLCMYQNSDMMMYR